MPLERQICTDNLQTPARSASFRLTSVGLRLGCSGIVVELQASEEQSGSSATNKRNQHLSQVTLLFEPFSGVRKAREPVSVEPWPGPMRE